jgi:hypothetical protein
MTSTVHPQTLEHVKHELHKKERRSERRILTEKMTRFVLRHFAWLGVASVQDYTYERYETDFPDAKADLDIFDGSGKLAFQGREFRSGMAGYWRPSRVSMVPEWSSNEMNWGREHPGRVLAEAPALGRS